MLNFELKITAFAGTVEALTALKRGRCVGLLYDDTAIGRSARITSLRRSMTRRPGARCFRRTIRQCEKYDEDLQAEGRLP